MTRDINLQLCVIAGLCLASSAPSFAQDAKPGSAPALVRGAFTLNSSLGVVALEDSNIFQSATAVQSSQIWKLTPSLLMSFEPARSRLELGYNGDYGWYATSRHDNYTDHLLDAGAYLLLGERSGLDLVASYKDTHENRGTGLTQGVDRVSSVFPQDPDRYIDGQALARYTYGVSHTRAFLALEASTQKLAYQNNLARTRQFDRADSYGQATFGWRVQPKTSLELRMQVKDITYDLPRASGLGLDSREYRYLLGVVWEATARTTGSVRFGKVNRKFDDHARPEFSGPSWEVTVRWSPRTYSHFDLTTRRYTEEPVDLRGDVTDTAIYALSWSHEWNNRLESKLALSEFNSTYRYATGNRKDNSPQFALAISYKMRPWLRWEAGVDVNARSSDVASYTYHQNIARLAARVTF